MEFLALFLLMVFLATFRRNTVAWLFCLSWLIPLVPIATGLITYNSAYFPSGTYTAVLFGYMVVFLSGVAIEAVFARQRGDIQRKVEPVSASSSQRTANIAWATGVIGTALLMLDFILFRSDSLSDLAALRENVGVIRISVFAMLASVLTWGALYSFAYAVYFNRTLSERAFFTYLLPAAGFFMVSVFSAGRQSVFQILVLMLVLYLLKAEGARQRPEAAAPGKSGRWVFLAGIGALAVVYMSALVTLRNDGIMSTSKTDVLISLFDFDLHPAFASLIFLLPQAVHDAVVEALVYFTNAIPLFAAFLDYDDWGLSLGATTFPVVFRQFEAFTGISVAEIMLHKTEILGVLGVMPVGWTTSLSSFVMDFGFVGSYVVFLLQGYLTAAIYRSARRSNRFELTLVAAVMLMAVVYSPMLPAFSDTNILLLLIFCFSVEFLRRLRAVAAVDEAPIVAGHGPGGK